MSLKEGWRRYQHRAPGRLNGHSEVSLHTPASVHCGTAQMVCDERAATLGEAYECHPELFARRPRSPEISRQVWIDDPTRRRDLAPQTS
ncbi:hypothetical protein [Streptomyces sp. NPDC056512]|uniref:hypothetical protein n=1 Tax=Streptomyces sp. NPDC056512 TaxID=3345846 RepID=UPI00369D495D